jgi:hypothetical protein
LFVSSSDTRRLAAKETRLMKIRKNVWFKFTLARTSKLQIKPFVLTFDMDEVQIYTSSLYSIGRKIHFTAAITGLSLSKHQEKLKVKVKKKIFHNKKIQGLNLVHTLASCNACQKFDRKLTLLHYMG